METFKWPQSALDVTACLCVAVQTGPISISGVGKLQ